MSEVIYVSRIEKDLLSKFFFLHLWSQGPCPWWEGSSRPPHRSWWPRPACTQHNKYFQSPQLNIWLQILVLNKITWINLFDYSRWGMEWRALLAWFRAYFLNIRFCYEPVIKKFWSATFIYFIAWFRITLAGLPFLLLYFSLVFQFSEVTKPRP